jgi:uncharacterized protein YprB with RNaseH-like and TPR domain
MTSFLSKLARLPPSGVGVVGRGVVADPTLRATSEPRTATLPPQAIASVSNLARSGGGTSGGLTVVRPTLDELRDRIAKIVGRSAPSERDSGARARSVLPFVAEDTELGPLHVHRRHTPPAARAGRFPLIAARDADMGMLALLALDPSLARCNARRALFVDTETTGLAGGTGTVPFLLGLAWFDDVAGTFVVEQALLRQLGEEASILALFAKRVAAADLIVTYNGKAFDLPLLRTRYVMNRLRAPQEPPHLDLVHVVRRIHRPRIKVCTLVTVESEVLGRERIGDVSGADIVAAYGHFLRTGDDQALAGVIEHNEADVLSMVALLGLYGEPVATPEIACADSPTGLSGSDLAGVARTLKRAGALDEAERVAEAAVRRAGGANAYRIRGDIAKARGDKARALADYERLASEVDDPTLRLELAKLYEHYMGAFSLALSVVDRGTGEGHAAIAHRRHRLERKLTRSRRS